MPITVASWLGGRRAALLLVPACTGAYAGVCHRSPGMCMQPTGTPRPPAMVTAALGCPCRAVPVPVPVPASGSSAGPWLSPAPCSAPPMVSRLQTSCNLGLKISEGEGGELVARLEQGWVQVRGCASPRVAMGGGPSPAVGSLQILAWSCRNDMEMQQILLVALVALSPHMSATSGVPRATRAGHRD